MANNKKMLAESTKLKLDHTANVIKKNSQMQKVILNILFTYKNNMSYTENLRKNPKMFK